MEEDVRMLLLYILYIYVYKKKAGSGRWVQKWRAEGTGTIEIKWKGGRVGAMGKSDEAGRRKRRYGGGGGRCTRT